LNGEWRVDVGKAEGRKLEAESEIGMRVRIYELAVGRVFFVEGKRYEERARLVGKRLAGGG
jgi:hypothetical protein